MSKIIKIQSLQTWSSEILNFLDHNEEVFIGRKCSCCNNSYTSEYDQVIYQFKEILREYSLIGYHCTKLCSHEIDEILQNGMSLQDLNTLSKRIDILQEKGLVNSDIAKELKTNNNANEEGRSHMLWFCFFEPFIAGRSGIQHFFQYWGGEALYGLHQKDPTIGIYPKTGIILQKIGIPCIVKAIVPMNYLAEYCLPVDNMFRVFLESKGHILDHPTEQEGYSFKSIPSENILKIIKYPSQEFVTLTKCGEWYDYID